MKNYKKILFCFLLFSYNDCKASLCDWLFGEWSATEMPRYIGRFRYPKALITYDLEKAVPPVRSIAFVSDQDFQNIERQLLFESKQFTTIQQLWSLACNDCEAAKLLLLRIFSCGYYKAPQDEDMCEILKNLPEFLEALKGKG